MMRLIAKVNSVNNVPDFPDFLHKIRLKNWSLEFPEAVKAMEIIKNSEKRINVCLPR